MTTPFRVLILDDSHGVDIPNELERYKTLDDRLANYGWNEIHCGFVKELCQSNDRHQVEVYLSPSAYMDEVWRLHTGTYFPCDEERGTPLGTEKRLREFLGTLDVLILDLGGIGPTRTNPTREILRDAIVQNFQLAGLKEVDDTILDSLGDRSSSERIDSSGDIEVQDGIKFFHQYMRDLSPACLVAVLTQTSDDNVAARELLFPFTLANEQVPFVTKYDKKGHTNDTLADAVMTQFEFVSSGLTDPTNRRQIALAACHDLPVMIIGESGTGKERIAQTIHRLWLRKKQRNFPELAHRMGQLQIVNCGGMNEQLARSELFGYVKHSFTDAREHRLGRVFLAGGIAKLGQSKKKTLPKKGWDDPLEDLDRLLASIDKMSAMSEAGQDCWDHFRSEVVPKLSNLLKGESSQGSPLFKALQNAKGFLELATQSSPGASAEFRSALLAAHSDVLSEPDPEHPNSDVDLFYTPTEAIGTLFLDEFGDLPLAVQTLLLRYAQSGEVIPMGYPGAVQGLKARIIVATSDSRVAAFAGHTILGDFRSQVELRMPLRLDLLHRLRGQVIRVEPINEQNLRSSLQGMLDAKDNPKVTWTKEAVDTLYDKVSNLLKEAPSKGADGKAKVKDADFIVAFGHRRELQMFVDLVWAYAKSASEVGIRDRHVKPTRDGTLEVDKDVIARLWKPAMLRREQVVTSSASATSEANNIEIDISEVKDVQAQLFKVLKSSEIEVPQDTWRWSDIEERIQQQFDSGMTEAGEKVRQFISKLTDDYKGRDLIPRLALTGSSYRGNSAKVNKLKTFKTSIQKSRLKSNLKQEDQEH